MNICNDTNAKLYLWLLIFLKFNSLISNLFDDTNLFVFVHYLIYTHCIFSQNYLLCIISIVWYPMQYGKNAHRNNKSRWGRSQAMIGSSHPLYPPQEQMFVILINIPLKRIFIFLRRIWFKYSSMEYYTFWTIPRMNNDASYSLVGRKSPWGKMELLQNSVLAHSLCCPWWFLQDWKKMWKCGYAKGQL